MTTSRRKSLSLEDIPKGKETGEMIYQLVKKWKMTKWKEEENESERQHWNLLQAREKRRNGDKQRMRKQPERS